MSNSKAANLADWLEKTPTSTLKYIDRSQRNEIAGVLRNLNFQMQQASSAMSQSNDKLQRTLIDLNISNEARSRLDEALAAQKTETEKATLDIKKVMSDFDSAVLALFKLAELDNKRREETQKIEDQMNKEALAVFSSFSKSLQIADSSLSPALARLQTSGKLSPLPAPSEISSKDLDEDSAAYGLGTSAPLPDSAKNPINKIA